MDKFISSNIYDWDHNFGGLPKGKMIVFVIPYGGMGIGFGKLFLEFVEKFYLIDARENLIHDIQNELKEKEIRPKVILDINYFECGYYENVLRDYLRSLPKKDDALVYINGLQEFFVRRFEVDKTESIAEYVGKGVTTIGILYRHIAEEFNDRFATEIEDNSQLLINVVSVRSDISVPDRGFTVKKMMENNEVCSDSREIHIACKKPQIKKINKR